MTSGAPSSLMDKIQMVDPMNALAPMRSLEGQDRAGTVREGDDREKSVSEAVQEEVERRQTKAVQELQAKYASGRGGDDASENGPTGHAYTAAAVAERDRRKGLKDRQSANDEATAQKEAFREAEVRAMHRAAQGESDEEDGQGAAEDLEEDSDEEYLRDLDDDPELAKIRNARMLDIKSHYANRAEALRKGHGELTEIVQDDFLPRITASQRCVVHFYHNDFHRCKIMDKHLRILAHNHLETLFLVINAEKAPFFCAKLQVQVLPTVICFFEGKTNNLTQRQMGFIGLDPVPGGSEDEWPTHALERKLGEIGVIDYTAKATDEELRKYGLVEKTSIYSTSRGGVRGGEDDQYDE
mmetsp:Transcript_63735/g.128062  ORF Transcript_63735/g.128062 Transcript_63735/m.128062 type:complete len:355 (+) Transcript_63735:65-1129(+)